ncbi:MAG: MaoC family dehydratase N-terminal domain-containing protein [Polyangiaceae bacterium]|nr:MaoC family dehydratase N-terminal domain-containing protein [Polyangiaceae bacterium]
MPIDPASVGRESGEHVLAHGADACILYALGVGARRDELDLLYEGRGPRVLMSFPVVPAAPAVFECLTSTGAALEAVVHGAQSVRVHRDLRPEATLRTRATVKALYDLKRFAQVVIATETRDGDALVAETEWSLIVRDGGGFGGPRPDKRDEPKPPAGRAPDSTVEQATSPEQALLYRLSGDKNPLHADPELAARVGFAAGPLLHGLCTYGFALRAFEGAFPSRRVTRFDAKFQKPVWPGEVLETSLHALDDGRVTLSTRVPARGETVLSGWLDAREEG